MILSNSPQHLKLKIPSPYIQSVRVCTINAEVEEVPEDEPCSCSMSTRFTLDDAHVLSVHSDKTALIQTPLNALVVAIEHLGNLFIMPER